LCQTAAPSIEEIWQEYQGDQILTLRSGHLENALIGAAAKTDLNAMWFA